MEYKPYPTYKDSDVEWLRELPEEWSHAPLKFSSLIENSGSYGSEEGESEHDLPVCTTAHITPQDELQIEKMPIRSFLTAEVRRYVGTPGDIFVVKSSGSNTNIISGKLSRIKESDGAVIFSNFLMRVRPDSEKVTSALLAYFLSSSITRERIKRMVATTTYPNINVEDYVSSHIPLPPETDQVKIVSFLDRETTRIDTLIEKKQRLIELLKEKRQAVITQAVTKGLDPSVPMKDSGVEWLGEVPEHWFVGRLGYYGLVNNGTTPSKANDEYWFDGDVPWLSSGAVNQETVLTPSEYITRKALTECSVKMLQVGTVIVGMIGQGKTRGMSAILAVSATINQNLAAVVTDNRLSSYYLHYVFKAAYESIRNVGRGGNQAALNCEILSDMKIPVPEYDEQAKIVDAIKSRISKIDVVEEQSERSLSLLKEHRSALITAAVTGQIDVRNLA